MYDRSGASGYDYKGLRVVLGGRSKQFNPGNVQRGESMGAEVTIEVTKYLVEVDGQTVIDIDKLNERYIVNGEDLLAPIKALI